MRVFKEATLVMTQEHEPTLCRYISSIYGIRNRLVNPVPLQNGETADTDCSEFRKNLLQELNDRFEFINDSESLILAMILDPRTKDRLLSADKKAAAHRVLYSVASEYLDVSDVGGENVQFNQTSGPAPDSTLMDFYDDIGRNEVDGPTDTVENEINNYMEEKVKPRDTNILEWWRENAAKYQKLAHVANHILGVPASQAYSERLFSRAGNIVTEKRSCLLSQRVEQLCFLSANIRQ